MTFKSVTEIIVDDLIWDIDSLPRNNIGELPMNYAIYILFEREIHKLRIKAINMRYLVY